MANWSYFYPRLMPRVMGCPNPLADAELRNASREFFEKTRAWRQWLDWFTTFEGVRQYDIDVPVDTQVVRIEQATKDASPMSVDAAFILPKDPATHAVSGGGLSSADRTTIILGADTTTGSVIQLQCSLQPSEQATGIPDHLAAQYTDAIVSGALFRIRTLAGQPFTDVSSAALDLAKFEDAISSAQAAVFRSNTNTMPRRRPQWC